MTAFSYMINPPKPTYPEYADLLTLAHRTVPRFVDPRNLDPSGEVVGRRGEDWRIAVLGRLGGSATYGRLSMVEHQLLILADQADIDPPLPEWVVEGRAETARRDAELARQRQELHDRDATAWKTALEKATVEFEIRPNPTAHRYSGFNDHVCHAIPAVDAYSGEGRRVRRHPAGRALCETERRGKPLRLGEPTDAPATCVRCLEWATKVRATRALVAQ